MRSGHLLCKYSMKLKSFLYYLLQIILIKYWINYVRKFIFSRKYYVLTQCCYRKPADVLSFASQCTYLQYISYLWIERVWKYRKNTNSLLFHLLIFQCFYHRSVSIISIERCKAVCMHVCVYVTILIYIICMLWVLSSHPFN